MLVTVHEFTSRALLIDHGLRLKRAELRSALSPKLVPLEDVERKARVILGALEHARAKHLVELRRGLVDVAREVHEPRVPLATEFEPLLERVPRDARGLARIAERGADATSADDLRADLRLERERSGHGYGSAGVGVAPPTATG